MLAIYRQGNGEAGDTICGWRCLRIVIYAPEHARPQQELNILDTNKNKMRCPGSNCDSSLATRDRGRAAPTQHIAQTTCHVCWTHCSMV